MNTLLLMFNLINATLCSEERQLVYTLSHYNISYFSFSFQRYFEYVLLWLNGKNSSCKIHVYMYLSFSLVFVIISLIMVTLRYVNLKHVMYDDNIGDSTHYGQNSSRGRSYSLQARLFWRRGTYTTKCT